MKLNSKCMACQIRKQEAKIRHFNDEDRKKQYMEAIRQRFEHPKDDDCVPSISTELKKFYCSFWGVPMEDFTRINKEYDHAFRKYDVLQAPAAPYTAPKIGESLKDPLAMYL